MPVIRPHALRGILLLACSCVGFGLAMIGMHVPFIFLLARRGRGLGPYPPRRPFGLVARDRRLADLGDLVRSRMLGHDGLILGTTGIMPRPTFWEGLCGLWSPRNPADIACLPVPSTPWAARKWVGDRMIRHAIIHAFGHLRPDRPGQGRKRADSQSTFIPAFVCRD